MEARDEPLQDERPAGSATTTPAAPTASKPRIHGLDALRGGALLLGIVLHGLLMFVAGMPWVVEDTQKSASVGVATLTIHLFRMPVFMFLAGYFGCMSLGRRGVRDFIRDRWKRIGLPFLVFAPLMLAAVVAVAMTAAARSGVTLPPPSATPEGVPPLLMILSPGHLWFLWTLLQLYALVLLLHALLGGRPSARALGARLGDWLTRPGGVVLPAVTYAVAMALAQEVIGGQKTLIPEVPSTIAYFGAFGTGWLLWGRDDALPRLQRQWPVHLGLAVAVTAGIVVAMGTTMNMEARITDPRLAVACALTVWLWCYGLVGWCVKAFAGENKVIRYLADASYWLYIIHLPLVLAMQLLLVDVAWPWPVKAVLIIGVPLVILLVTYDVWVRSTWLGAWLNGRRYPAVGPWRRA